MSPAEADNPLGLRRYEVRLPVPEPQAPGSGAYTVEATFEHRRGDGLARCLLEASKAVDRARARRAAELVARACQADAERLRAAPANRDT